MKFRMSQGQATRSTFTLSRVIHFMYSSILKSALAQILVAWWGSQFYPVVFACGRLSAGAGLVAASLLRGADHRLWWSAPWQGRRQKPIVCPTLVKNQPGLRGFRDLVVQAC